ncbi:hypothetical protein C499_15240 [Halogeometricum borinquense DSM 11551]|uniref:Twin-arginine translocation signal domain-containing protein n=1 Tax=Halogeometricum borinquense (strain ATCC 700274 / DSM 11551 / JCM 10706 / KCTC 4070 / PR3) TaxID=469382 RepID=E4NT95_HALBP|nr:hypothetical protein [Halogeometricum borinquense]ADQ68192.1 hypothetical protein Hbor_26400 [Halogeometricum borinquense DSM 11551]ELY24764.1 hypothetical protein C499_15240 [Halogeometricum borinquense DSM 11551]
MTDKLTSTTRRGFLALAGTAALAGCSGLNPLSEDEETRIDATALQEAISGDAPAVTSLEPVNIEQSYIDRSVTEARERLSTVPAPFDAEEIPNGMIRADLTDEYEEAKADIEDVTNAESTYEAFQQLRGAHESVRTVAAGWRAIDGDVTYGDIQAEIPTVRDDMDGFRGRWRYVGDDPIRAVLAHAAIEDRVSYTGRRLQNDRVETRSDSKNPILLGEFAGEITAARVSLQCGEYLYDRFTASLDETRSVGAGLRAAGETLSSRLDKRRKALPEPDRDPSSYVDADVEDTPIGYALDDLQRNVAFAHGIDNERATGQRANLVLSAFSTLIRIRAFERLRERAENDDYVTVESADDVRKLRNRAVDAVESAKESGEHPRLNRYSLRDVDHFDYVSRRLGRYTDEEDGGVSARRINDIVEQYVLIEAIAQATPKTSAEAADVIQSNM